MASPRDDMQSLPEGIAGIGADDDVPSAMHWRRSEISLQTQNDRLRHLLLQLRPLHFGPRSEHLPEEQLQLGFEAIEQAIAKADACEGGEFSEQGLEAVDRQAVSSALGGCLAASGVGTLRGCDDGGSRRGSLGALIIVEQ